MSTSSSDFRIIRPITITDAKLTSTDIPEAIVTEYNAATTYASGDIRGVTTGTSQAVYKSLQAGNVGHSPASSPTWWKQIGTVYANYSSGTTYALGDIVTDPVAHQLYKSLVAANTGNLLTDATKWLSLGATNRWKMFDKAVNSQSSQPDSITFTLSPGELVNTVTLLNVEGSTVTVTQSISGYTMTKSLVKHEVLNWYDWYYEEPIRAGDVVIDNIPPYANATLTITISNPGDTAAIGCCFIGKARTLGTTQWGLTGGIISYSTTNTDTFGNVTIVKRSNARRMNCEVYIPPGFESEAFRLLSTYTDTEMVFIAATDYTMTYTYGFLGQWEIPISNSGKTAPIEIRGLV